MGSTETRSTPAEVVVYLIHEPVVEMVLYEPDIVTVWATGRVWRGSQENESKSGDTERLGGGGATYTVTGTTMGEPPAEIVTEPI